MRLGSKLIGLTCGLMAASTGLAASATQGDLKGELSQHRTHCHATHHQRCPQTSGKRQWAAHGIAPAVTAHRPVGQY